MFVNVDLKDIRDDKRVLKIRIRDGIGTMLTTD